jgi:hypothetical protein
MNLESWAYISEIVGAIAVVASLIYVGIQIRDSNRVNQANARHNISEFVLQVSMFNAGHADRIAAIQQKISEGEKLTGAEHTFQWWSHMNMMLHAETYYHHYELGLMPDGHWKGYVRYVEGYSIAPGFADFWKEAGPAFSRNFCNWMTEVVNRNNDLNLPSHDDA